MKKNLIFLAVLWSASCLFASGNKEVYDIKATVPAGAPAAALIKLIKENKGIDNVNITWEVVNNPSLLAARAASGESDILLMPTNLGANLYNKGVKFKLLSPVVWGTFYITGPDSLKEWDDLRGKTIHSFGKSLSPDLVLKYILREKGLEQDVEIVYTGGVSELAPLVLTDKAEIALLAEPVLSKVLSKKKNLKPVFNIQDAWAEITGSGSYPQASLFISEELLEKAPHIAEALNKLAAEAVEWAKNNPEEAGKYYAETVEGLPAPVITGAIPRCHLNYGDSSRDAVEQYLEVIQVTLPPEAFYY